MAKKASASLNPAEIHELKMSVCRLKQEISKLKSELAASEGRYSAVDDQNSELRVEIEDLKQKNRRLTTTLEARDRQISELRGESEVSEDRIRTLDMLNSEGRTQVERLKQEIHKLTVSLSARDSQVCLMQDEIAVFRAQVADLKQAGEVAEQRLSVAHEDNSKVLERNWNLCDRIDAIDAEKNEVRATNSELLREIAGHKEMIEQTCEGNRILGEQVAELKKKNRSLADSVVDLYHEIDALREAKSETCELLAKTERELEEYKDELASCEANGLIEALKTENGNLREMAEATSQRFLAADTSLAAVERELSKSMGEIEALTGENQRLREQIQSLQMTVAKKSSAISSGHVAAVDRDMEIAQLRSKLNQAEHQLDCWKERVMEDSDRVAEATRLEQSLRNMMVQLFDIYDHLEHRVAWSLEFATHKLMAPQYSIGLKDAHGLVKRHLQAFLAEFPHLHADVPEERREEFLSPTNGGDA